MIQHRHGVAKGMLRFSGIAASRGIAIGPAYRFARTLLNAEDRELNLSEVGSEIERFDGAVSKARQEIEKVRHVAEQKVGTSASSIFEAQMMMVSDEFILSTIRQRIKHELKPAAYAVDVEFSAHQKMLEASENPIMRERADDIEDIKQRLLRYLLDHKKWLSKIEVPSIVVSGMLTPADAILFSRSSTLGFALDGGGVTSHVAILARSLGIPALLALHAAAEHIETGDTLILDGELGELIVCPDAETLSRYEQEQTYLLGKAVDEIGPITHEDEPVARTTDGHAVTMLMNLEFGSEVAITEAERLSEATVRSDGKKQMGLGLVRTEHFLLLHDEFPLEEEQTSLYKDIADRFYPASVTLRTFDVGGDKVLSGTYREDNPFLGWRGLRISLDEPELFLAQLRAILRASARGNVKVMFPMVTTIDELKHALDFVTQAKNDLRAKGEAFDEQLPVGIMIEVPSAAIMAESFVPFVDYFSIGSNDLTQYTLAVDRCNDLISTLYQELHPAVLRLIQMTVDAGKRGNKPVTICGELGSYPLATPLLVGMGMDGISVAPSAIRSLAERLRTLHYKECQELTAHVLANCVSHEEVKQQVFQFLSERNLIDLFNPSKQKPGAKHLKK
jgi:phosphoenolpyruvate-protein phosphotransferase (PTS system enzyme I)